MAKATAVGGGNGTLETQPTNGGQEAIDTQIPFIANIRIRGVADILFHAWNCEAVDAKSKAAKGSKEKKTDNVESFVYRNDEGVLCIPGEYLRGSICNAAKFRQDPRSPRKSAHDLFRAAIVSLTPLASMGIKDWSYEHKCRVVIQRSAITRTRPAIKAGWEADFQFLINLPEYVSRDVLHEVATNAGRLIGIGDFRPSYGRFSVVKFWLEELK